MKTDQSNESKILDKVSTLEVIDTITVDKSTLSEINFPRLRVYITRYGKQNSKVFKTQLGINGNLVIMRTK